MNSCTVRNSQPEQQQIISTMNSLQIFDLKAFGVERRQMKDD
jgi:hypothetical protein